MHLFVFESVLEQANGAYHRLTYNSGFHTEVLVGEEGGGVIPGLPSH